MKVLYFHQHFSNPNGSVGTRSYEMARRLIIRGHQVTMVCGSYMGGKTGIEHPFVKGKRRGSFDGIDIIEFDLAYSNNDNFLKRVTVFIKFALSCIILVFREKYDVVFATSTPLTVAIPGIFARWLKFKPFVFEIRDLWPTLPKAMGVIKNPIILSSMSLLELLGYYSSTLCIGLSPGIIDHIHRRGLSKEKIILIPNGCDLEIFGAKLLPWRPKGVKPKDFIALFSGTHGIANGLDIVLDTAFELKNRKRSDIKLVLVGQGKMKKRLLKRAFYEKLDNIIFLDPVNKKQLAGLMASSDIGLQILANFPAFYYGTSPNKFFDYISSGLPVLNNYPGWLNEMICEHKCGFVIEPNNHIAFADSLEHAANNRHELVKMGINAKKLAKYKFNREDLGNLFVDCLERSIK